MIKKLQIIFLIFLVFSSCKFNNNNLIPVKSEITMEKPDLYCDSAILSDYATGTILYEKNSNLIIPPASMTKLVVNYIVFKEIDRGNISLDDFVPIDSEADFRNQPARSSLMFLEKGQKVTLRECLIGLAIPSGNDAAVAVAKYVSGDVESFLERMNTEMRNLGLENTEFSDTSGYSEKNRTTAAEFLKFITEYINLFPGSIADFHSIESFAYPEKVHYGTNNNSVHGKIVQYNHNHLINRVAGVDGLKTGYIDESGFNVALSAEKDGLRLIGVIMGSRAETPLESRRRGSFDAAVLLTYGFSSFKSVEIYPELTDSVKVWKGKNRYADIKIPESVKVTVPLDKLDNLFYKFEIDEPLIAPLEKGISIGRMNIYAAEKILKSVALENSSDIESGNYIKRLFDEVQILFIHKLFK